MSNSFKDILKSTGLIGFFEVFRLFLGLFRNKLIALFLGTTGIGIWGLYLSFTELIQGVSSLGLDKSTVKMVAENKENLNERNTVIKVAQISYITFSLICSIVAAVFSGYFSESIFGSRDYQIGILICSVVIFLNSVSAILKSVLNGLREIKKIVYSQLVGVFIGNAIVLCLVPFYGLSAIPMYLLLIALFTFLPLIFAVRKLNINYVAISFKEGFQRLSKLMKVGFAFWSSAIFIALIAYLIKIFLQKELSVEVVGIYQASWTISNLYVGIVLTSMGVDFFPKICEAITEKKDTNSIINEQIEFGLLVSFPFIVGILIFAPELLSILFSSEFKEGALIIRWQMLGVVVRLLGFPFGYALMAKGKTKQYMFAQLSFSSLNYLFIILLVHYLGFKGLGINYFVAYFIYVVIIGSFCVRELNYYPSKFLIKVSIIILVTIVISFVITFVFNELLTLFFGVGIVFCVFYYSYIQLSNKLGFNVLEFIKNKIR